MERRDFLRSGATIGVFSTVGCIGEEVSELKEDASGLVGDPRGSAPEPNLDTGIPQPSGWTSFGHNNRNTSYNPEEGLTGDPSVVWTESRSAGSDLPDPVFDGDRRPGPIVFDEVAYFHGPAEAIYNYVLYGYSIEAGEEVYEGFGAPGGGETNNSVLAGANGNAYIRTLQETEDNRSPVVAFGNSEWTTDLTSRTLEPSGVTIAYETVFVTGGPRVLYALSTDTGELRWESKPGASSGVPAIVDDTIYVTTRSGVSAFDVVTGEEKWSYEIPSTDSVSASGGTLLVSTESGVQALDTEGDEQWSVNPGRVAGTPAIANRTAIAATVEGTVLAVDIANGEERWRKTLNPQVTAPVAIDDDTVYVPTHSGIITLSLDDGTQQWRLLTEKTINSQPAVAHGALFVVGADYSLNKIGTE